MSWDRFEGNWNQTKEKIRAKWSKLTTDDLDAIHGRRDLLESTIEQRYGFAPDYVRKEVDNWFRWQDWRSPSSSPWISTPCRLTEAIRRSRMAYHLTRTHR